MSAPSEKGVKIREIDAVSFEQLAERDGVEAFVAGEHVEQNPFTPNSPLHEAWARGWTEASARHE